MSITVEMSDETYDKIKDQLLDEEKYDVSCLDDFVGKKFFFRTVTYHAVGKITKRIGSIFQLEDASWVADSGRFMNAIKEGTLEEVEPVGIMFINIQATTDFFPWVHPLPTKQK